MKTVLIPTKLDPVCREILVASGRYDVVQDESSGLDAVVDAHPDAHALIVRSEPVTAAVIDRLKRLKVVVRAGAGFNTIDIKYARRQGVDVMNTPGANSNAVAEEVLAMILADARHVVAADASVRAGRWDKKLFMGTELAGKTVGIVGLGNIGRLVARRLSGFDVTLLGYDPVISEERAHAIGVEPRELCELVAESDYLTLHVPENDSTRKMINRELLAQAKPGMTIVNCARAGLVDEDAVRAAKAERGIRLLNDVYEKDEAGDKSVAEFADLVMPHLGASTREANRNAARQAAEQLLEFDERGVTSYIVNRDIPVGLNRLYCDLAFTLTKLCMTLQGPKAKAQLLETSFYGTLEPYGDWLLVPVATALCPGFEPSLDHSAAKDYLEGIGIDYRIRQADASKGYDNSITVDLTCSLGAGNMRKVSVRGTVVERHLMISRIDDFDQLFFDPAGHTVVFVYMDRPGVIAMIASSLADAGINIDDVRNPHNSKGDQSIAMFKTSQAVPVALFEKIRKQIDALAACVLDL